MISLPHIAGDAGDRNAEAGAAKAPRGVHDPERLKALQATGLLDSPPEPAFDRLTRLATTLLRAPVAAVSLVDERRQFFKSAVGLSEPWASRRETPLSHSFCRHVVESEQPLVVDDAREHPLVCENLAVPELGVTAYLGVPLRTPTGHVLGALCVIDGVPRAWGNAEVALMGELATSVATEIELQRALDEARARAEEAERAAAALREREGRLRLLADAAFEGIAVSFEGRIIDGNEAFAALFGYERGKLAGMSAAAFVTAPEHERVVSSHRMGFEGAYETVGLRKDGTTFAAEARGRMVPWGGRTVRITAVRDLTERKRAEGALLRQTAFVELLRATATEANGAATSGAALRACVGRVCAHMGWPVGHVYAVAPETAGPELVPTELWHLDDETRFEAFREVTMWTRLPSGFGLPGRVLADGRAHWMVNVVENADFVRRDAARASGLRAGLAFPVLVGEEVAAVLEFYSERAEEPDESLLEVMANVGTQLGRVVERERARVILERHAAETQALSNTDELTGLCNRRGFLARAAPLLTRSERSGKPALLFFADLNGMKKINDELGHDVGDEALRETARLLRATFRESDVIARLGGDEFVALRSDAWPDLVEALRGRLCALVDARNTAPSRPSFRLSVSLGAAIYDPRHPRPLEALLAEADALMYEQKRLRKIAGTSLPAPPPRVTTPSIVG